MNISNPIKIGMALLSSVLLIGIGQANAAEDPIAMLKGVTSGVMQVLRAHRSELRSNPNQVYQVANQYILPHVDFEEVARWVVGRNAWGKADSATQRAFIDEFKIYVVRSYARSLLEYSDQKIEFLPLRGAPTGQRIQVSSLIRETGRSPIHMDYRLINVEGSWRVYDIIIEGVSLMQGYHAQFAEDVRRGGVSAAVEKMRRHNGKREQGKR